MSNTVRIFRNLSALRSCRNVFSLKYCTSQKDDKDSGVKNDVDKSSNDALDRENKTIQQGSDSETAKPNVVSNITGTLEKSKSSFLESLSHIASGKSDPSSTDQSSSSDSDSDSSTEDEVEGKKKVTFKDFMGKVESGSVFKSEEKESETFASLLRKSPLIELGDPVGKLVVGTINVIVNEDAYIDFGWKFPAVCQLPKTDFEGLYKPGSKVIIKILDLELTAKFLGDVEYTSLLEADCELVSLYGKDTIIEVK